jgi:hypothetical protein
VLDTTDMVPEDRALAAALAGLSRDDLELYAFVNAGFLGRLSSSVDLDAVKTLGEFPAHLCPRIEELSLRVRETVSRLAAGVN